MNSFAGWLADDSFVHLFTSPRNVPLLLPATPSIFHNPVPPISKIRFYDTANQCTYMDSKKELQWLIFGDVCVWDCRRFPSCCHSFTNDYSKVALKLGINQVSIRLPFHYLFIGWWALLSLLLSFAINYGVAASAMVHVWLPTRWVGKE
jgi:hypothetical protein